MSQGLVTYIVLGSEERLKTLKLPVSNKDEEYIFANFSKLEQGIFFSKRLYFSVGGIGDFGSDPFKEISKRFYTRIDPQNPLPALIIRTTNLEIF